MNIKNQEKVLLDIIEAHKTPSITNVAGIDYLKVGQPREIYRYFVGQVLENEVQNGYGLAKSLIDEALRRKLTGKDGKIHNFAISLNQAEITGKNRVKGLNRALAEYDDQVVFHKLFNTEARTR